MRRTSGRRLGDAKVYQIEGAVQQYDYSTQKLEVDDNGNKVMKTVYYNLIEGPVIRKFEYKQTIGINNSSEFTVESKANFLVGPEDRFFLLDKYGSYGKVETNRLVNKKVYNPSRHKVKTTEYEQIIAAG